MRKVLCLTLTFVLTACSIPIYSSGADYYNYWSFNSTLSSEGEVLQDGVTSVEPQWVNGVLGKALNVGGANRFLKLSDYSKNLDGSSAITVAGSFKNYDMPPGDPKQYMILKTIISGTLGGFNVYIENNMLVFEARSNPDDKMQAVKAPFLDVGNWHSFAAVADYANKVMTLYIDGIEVATGKPAFGSDKFVCGTPSNPDFTIGGAGSNMFNGAVDEFMIFKKALEKSEVEALAVSASDSSQNQYIIGGWSFDDGNGIDSRGSGIKFDVSGYTTESGKLGGGLSFADQTKPLYLDKKLAKALDKKQAVTVSMWFKNNSMPSGNNVYSLFKTYNGARPGFEVQITSKGIAVAARSTVYDKGACEVFPYNDKGNWHHIIVEVSFKGKTVRLYLDGVLLGTGQADFRSNTYKLTNINGFDSIGGFNSTTMLDGSIDEIVLLSKPVEQAEIESLKELSVNDAKINNIILLEVNFTDIKNHWAEESIVKAAKRGIIKGITNNIFEPELNIKRYEFVELISNMAEIKPVKYKNVVMDITGQDKFADAFQGIYDAGIIERHLLEGQKFNPNSAITVQDAAVIAAKLYEYLKLNFEENNSSDTIKGVQAWANPYVNLAQKTGILNFNDVSGNSFLTRAQAAVMLSRFIDV